MITVTYSDGTPPVTYTYDRVGRMRTVKDAVTGQDGERTFSYRTASTSTDTEAITAGQKRVVQQNHHPRLCSGQRKTSD